MKRAKGSSVLFGIGAVLIAAAVAAVVGIQAAQRQSAQRAAQIAAELTALMPTVQDDEPDGRTDVTMPVVEADGADYIGLLELPAHGITLPVRASWRQTDTMRSPCRYDGSMYDGSLILGGSVRPGQLDCMDEISVGDRVCMTDMDGTRYTYFVAAAEKTRDVSAAALGALDCDLVIFARNTFALDYTVVRAVLRSKTEL